MDKETTLSRKRVEDAEIEMNQEQEDMRNAEKVGLTTTQPEPTFEEMLQAIRDSLSYLGINDGEDAADKDDDEEDP